MSPCSNRVPSPGGDIIREILRGPKIAERMELELSRLSRLAEMS